MRVLILLLALSLIGCADGNTGTRYERHVYAQMSSTCNNPMTYISITTNGSFASGTVTPFEMGQEFLNRACKVFTKGNFIVDGNTLTTEFSAETTSGTCTNEAFIWDDVYSVTVTKNTLTLSNNSCTTTYQKP